MNKQDLAKTIDARRQDDPYDVFGWSLVSPQHKYLWNILPKNACVTTTITLREFEGNPHRGDDLWGDEGVLKLRDFGNDKSTDCVIASHIFLGG